MFTFAVYYMILCVSTVHGRAYHYNTVVACSASMYTVPNAEKMSNKLMLNIYFHAHPLLHTPLLPLSH